MSHSQKEKAHNWVVIDRIEEDLYIGLNEDRGTVAFIGNVLDHAIELAQARSYERAVGADRETLRKISLLCRIERQQALNAIAA